MRRFVLFASLVVALTIGAGPASGHEAVPYAERVMVGPYPVEVWVSDWPIAAQRSVEFTFSPEGASPTSRRASA